MNDQDQQTGLVDRLVDAVARVMDALGLNGTRLRWKWNQKRIQMGEAFDVVADRRQMEHRVLGRCAAETSWEIELRNRKDEAVAVQIVEPAGGDWELISSSHPATSVDAQTLTFAIRVGARDEVTVEYRIRVRWC